MSVRRLRRIDPISVAKITAILYFALGLLFAPFFLMMSAVLPDTPGFGIGMAIFTPIMYAIVGAIGSALAALLYNLIARFVGGIEVEVE